MTVLSRRPFGTVVDPDELSNDVRELATAIDKLSAGHDLTIEWHSLVKKASVGGGPSATLSGRILDSQGTRVTGRHMVLVLLGPGEFDIGILTGANTPVITSVGNLASRFQEIDNDNAVESHTAHILLTDTAGSLGFQCLAKVGRTSGIWIHGVVLGLHSSGRMFLDVDA